MTKIKEMRNLDSKGNIAIEYMLLVGIAFIITLIVINYVNSGQELDTALGAARSGALEGIILDNFAIYPEETFKQYEKEKEGLISTSSIKILKIEAINQGHDINYGKTKIQLKVLVSSNNPFKKEEKNSLGDRINFNIRKSISKIFKTENMTNAIYNPAFSPKYVFTTADVKWVN